jgi:PAS domain S-box-containing protein
MEKSAGEWLESLVLLEDVFESAPCGLMVLDNEGKVIMMNRHQERISKKRRESVLGAKFHETWKRLIEEDYYQGKYWEMLNKGTPFTAVFSNVLPQFYDIRISGIAKGVPLSSGKGFLLLHDISEEIHRSEFARAGAMSQLTESSQFMRDILDSSPNAVVATNAEGFIVLVNNTVTQTFGYTKGELLWENLSCLFDGRDKERGIPAVTKDDAGVEVRCRKRGGEPFPARMRVREIRTKEGTQGSRLFLFVDITHEKEMELSLQERLRFETLLSELSATFVNLPAEEIDNRITEGTKKVGQLLGAARGGLLQFGEDGKSVVISHSWGIEGIAPVRSADPEIDWPWITSKVVGRELLLVRDPGDLPDEAGRDRESMISYGVQSIILLPLVVGGRALGSLAFSTVHARLAWPEDLIKRLMLCAEMIANALLRKRADEELKEAFSKINQLKDQIEAERDYLREEIRLEHDYEDVIGQSRALQRVLQKVEHVAPTDATVIIMGETGTGKEVIARAIHDASLRNNRPLVKVDCAVLPSNLIESELFGHEKGAFSGAHARHVGRFEIADGGTLFLDEIGELPLGVQAKLLRAIQEGEFERLGSTKTIRANVRIVAATNRDLVEEVRSGRFREDLWYRLNVFPITVPPLRERREDIPLLVNWFVRKAAKKMGKQITRIPTKELKALEQYQWPGNVRELSNVIERGVINARGEVLRVVDALTTARSTGLRRTDKGTLADIERDYIVETLQETHWRISGKNGAANLLGLHPNTLRGRMQKLGIRQPWRVG